MAYATTVHTGEWNEFAGIWLKVLEDPLAGPGLVRLDVHPDPLRVSVRGANYGWDCQSYPPDTLDYDPSLIHSEPSR